MISATRCESIADRSLLRTSTMTSTKFRIEKHERHDGQHDDLRPDAESDHVYRNDSCTVTCSVVGPTFDPATTPSFPLISATGTPPRRSAYGCA